MALALLAKGGLGLPKGGPQVVSNAEWLPTSTEGGHCNAGPRMLWGSFIRLCL